MDANAGHLVNLSFVALAVSLLASLFVIATLARRAPARNHLDTHITAGDGAQINLGHARDMQQGRRATDGNGNRRTSNTNIQVCEDILASLGGVRYALAQAREHAAAAREGRHQGDPLEAVGELLTVIEQYTEMAALIGRLGREGRYFYLTSVQDLQEQSNGSGNRAGNEVGV